jgi:SAM-dependent methyltransferase
VDKPYFGDPPIPELTARIADEFDAFAADYDAAFRSWRCRLEDQMLAVRLRRFLSGVSGPLLDIGCGIGALMRLIDWPADRYTGLDVSGEMLAEAMRRYPRARFIQAPVEAMPMTAGQYDAVVSTFSALSYVAEPLRALAEIRRVLVPGGRFFLMVYAPRWYRQNPARMEHVNLDLAPAAWSSWQARERCRIVGFPRVRLSAFSILPTPLMHLDGLLARRLPQAGRYLIIESA